MYFITTKRMLEVCFFQHTPTFIIEPIMISVIEKRCFERSKKDAKNKRQHIDSMV